jgi:hypothetical protein
MNVYWLKLRGSNCLGYGITAADRNDAIALLARVDSTGLKEPVDATMIDSWREITDINELDQNHVVPNMGNLLRRGIWFPNLPGIE